MDTTALHFLFPLKFLRLCAFSWSCKARPVVDSLPNAIPTACWILKLLYSLPVPQCQAGFLHAICQGSHLPPLEVHREPAMGWGGRGWVRHKECWGIKWNCPSVYPILSFGPSMVYWNFTAGLPDFYSGNLNSGWLSKPVFFERKMEENSIPSSC